jgi:predicted metal-binding membrane protein
MLLMTKQMKLPSEQPMLCLIKMDHLMKYVMMWILMTKQMKLPSERPMLCLIEMDHLTK